VRRKTVEADGRTRRRKPRKPEREPTRSHKPSRNPIEAQAAGRSSRELPGDGWCIEKAEGRDLGLKTGCPRVSMLRFFAKRWEQASRSWCENVRRDFWADHIHWESNEDVPRIMRRWGRAFVMLALSLAIYFVPPPAQSLIFLVCLSIISWTYWAMYFSARRRRSLRRHSRFCCRLSRFWCGSYLRRALGAKLPSDL
jgi:hypothetical protein